jgi:hypothetical protein
MRRLRVLVLVSITLGTASLLMADSLPDPIIKYTIPGGHSIDLCNPDGDASCSQTIEDAIGANGFATIDLHDPATNPAVVEQSFTFETENLDQQFFATSTQFGSVTIVRSPSCEGCIDGTLEVDYSGVGASFTKPGSDFLAALPCEGDGCSIAGFTPGSSVTIDSTFADPPPTDSCCSGLQPNEHGELALTADTPEPGSLVLLFSAIGVLGLKRRISRR